MNPQSNNQNPEGIPSNEESECFGFENISEAIAENPDGFRRQRNKKNRRKRVLLVIFIVIVSLIVLLLAAVVILQAIGKKQMLDYENTNVNISSEIKDAGAADEEDGKVIKYGGDTYRLNENITTILCMGIDSEDRVSSGYGGNGQADANFLLAVDTSSGKINAISINRDTMVDVDVYSDSGFFAGAEKQQLCLAFANGDGKEQSCENMKKCVSSIFYGIPVNSYIAIDLEAIGILNDLVGGVTVNPPNSFNTSVYNFEQGKPVTLNTAEKAETFVRWRDVTVLESNLDRMQRQKVYLKAFAAAAIDKTVNNITFPLTLYSAIKDYNINDLNAAKITFLTSCVIKGRAKVNLEFLNVEGDVKQGEKYAEFYPDETKLFELILKVFYIKDEAK